MAATSGGWIQNSERLLGISEADTGTVNAARIMGRILGMAEGFLERNITAKIQLIAFSQGATAMREAQDALEATDIDHLNQHINFVTWGGAMPLRTNHISLEGIFDPIPIFGNKVQGNFFWPTEHGQAKAIQTNNFHKASSYAENHKKIFQG